MEIGQIAQPAPARDIDGTRAHRLVFVRRLALLCALLVLLITSLSAFIRLSKAGLSCPDWPACYGQGLRDLQQGRPAEVGEGVATAAARLAHRIVASTALLLVIAMLAALLSAPKVGLRPARPARVPGKHGATRRFLESARRAPWREARVALALLALALFLAVLGRWSSDARVPAVAIGNLLGGFAMLALSWRLAIRGAPTASPGLRLAAWLGTALLAAQVALGGLLSASYAATSCTSGLADCLAAARGLPIGVLDPWREPQLAALPPINPSGALALAAHGLLGLATTLVLAGVAVGALRTGRRAAGALLLAGIALAGALGWTMASQGPTLALALAHNVVAALLLVTAFELTRGAAG